MFKIFVFAIFLFISSILSSQELNCQVTVLSDAKLEVSSVEQEIFSQMKQTVFEFMNNTKWTKDKFSVEERINCNIQIQINAIPSPGVYEGTMQIQSSRPAFKSTYNTTAFNFVDMDISFPFTRNSVLIYAPNQFRDNITSVLAFYAYYILGVDYDSMSLKGGNPFFVEAQQIVANAQSSNIKGWMSNETSKKNRYWLIDNTLHQLFEPLRECNYEYNRKGLDQLFENKELARKNMFNALNKLNKISNTRPNSINVSIFVQAKTSELKNLFYDATLTEKTDLVNLLKKIDAVNSSKYQEILN
jgi:hypothetical protein